MFTQCPQFCGILSHENQDAASAASGRRVELWNWNKPKRVEELRAVIEKNNRLYYDQDAPELEDFEYDALTRELKELEAQYPELVTPASPTQHVGGTPSGRFAKVTHAVKMESLLDAFSYDELRDLGAAYFDTWQWFNLSNT